MRNTLRKDVNVKGMLSLDVGRDIVFIYSSEEPIVSNRYDYSFFRLGEV